MPLANQVIMMLNDITTNIKNKQELNSQDEIFIKDTFKRILESGQHYNVDEIESWFEKHGDKAVFFGRMVPVLREMVSIPAGLFRVPKFKFLAYTLCGSCVWSTALTLVGYYFGQITLGII